MIRALLAIVLLSLITSACTSHLQNQIFGKCSPYSKPGSVCKK